ncbi:MAG: hypothetical protein N2Z70_04795 [Bdellovibrionaceae bacterium]|nr:hypothetical protein [Pseudobdellovibrionaceae bacterium]
METATSQSTTQNNTNQSNTTLEQFHILSILAYFGILCLIPYFVEKTNTFVRYHTKQGMVLFGLSLFVTFANLLPFGWFDFITTSVLTLLSVGTLVLSVIGIINVLKNEQRPLPLIGKWAENLNI